LDAKFVDNLKSGKLFIITGKVKNEYFEPRSFIRVKGILINQGKQRAKTEIVYAGNIISDVELKNLNLIDINKRLANRFGQDHMNVKVDPGETIPFMVVFSNLPAQMEEYAVEVERSSPA
jgi:hypothetical protein